MTSSGNLILEVGFKAFDSLVNDRVLITPTEDGNVLLKLGEVSRGGPSLAKSLELAASSTSFVGITIVCLEVINEKVIVIDNKGAWDDGQEGSDGHKRGVSEKGDHVTNLDPIFSKPGGLKFKDKGAFGNERV